MSNLNQHNNTEAQRLVQELEPYCGTGQFVILNLTKGDETYVVAAQLKSVKEDTAVRYVKIELAQTSREMAEAFMKERARKTAESIGQPYEKGLDDVNNSPCNYGLPDYDKSLIMVGKYAYSVNSICEAPPMPSKVETTVAQAIAETRPIPLSQAPVVPVPPKPKKEEPIPLHPSQVTWSTNKTGLAHVIPSGAVLDGVQSVPGSSLEFTTTDGDTLKIERVWQNRVNGEHGVVNEELDIAIGGKVARIIDARMLSEDGLARASNVQSVFADNDRWIVTRFDHPVGQLGGSVVRDAIVRATGKVEHSYGSDLSKEVRIALSAMKKARDTGNTHIRVEQLGIYTTVLYDDAIIIRGDFVIRGGKTTVYKGWVTRDGLFLFYAPNGELIQLDEHGKVIPPREIQQEGSPS